MDDLTPLDARNSLLIKRGDLEASYVADHEENLPPYSKGGDRYYAPSIPESTDRQDEKAGFAPHPMYRDLTANRQHGDYNSSAGGDGVNPHEFVSDKKYSEYR